MRDRLLRWETALIVLCVAVFGYGATSTPGFADADNIDFLLLDYTEVALLALALLPIVLTGEIDLSVASVLGFCSALTGALWEAGVPFETIVPVVLLAGAVLGSVNAVLIVRFGLPSLAVTIGTLGLYRGLAYVVLGDGAVTGLPENYRPLAINHGVLTVAVVGIAVAVAVHVTPLGRSLYAIGLGEQTARFSGIRVDRIKMALFVFSGALAALASLIYTLRYNSARADNGSGLELAAVAAVLLGGVSIFGGRGTVLGVATALLLMAGLRNAMFLNDVSNEIQNVIIGLLLIISVLVPASMRRKGDEAYPSFASRSARRAARRRMRRNHEGLEPRRWWWSDREHRGSEQADQAGPEDRLPAQGDRQSVHGDHG